MRTGFSAYLSHQIVMAGSRRYLKKCSSVVSWRAIVSPASSPMNSSMPERSPTPPASAPARICGRCSSGSIQAAAC